MRPAAAKVVVDERAGPALRAPARAAGRATRRPAASRRAGPGEQLEQRAVERQRDARAVARLAVGPERAAVGQRRETRRARAAGPARATARRRPRRTRRRTHRARSARRRAARRRRRRGRWSLVAGRGHGWLRRGSSDRPPSEGGDGGRSRVVGERRPDADAEEAGPAPGSVRPGRRPRRGPRGRGRLLVLGRDADPEDDVDDLDDDERRDDGVGDRGARPRRAGCTTWPGLPSIRPV